MDTTTATAEGPRCVACDRTIDAWDMPRLACPICQERTATRLGELADLAGQAHLDLSAGHTIGSNWPRAGGTKGVAGSRVPPGFDLGVDAPSDPRGDVELLLDSWARDWSETADLTLPDRWEPTPIEGAARWLRWHLDWAFRNHEAADDFVREIGGAHGRLRGAVTGERGPRVMQRACPCGGRVPFRLGGRRFTCGSCGTVYGYAEATHLPPAKRTVAAA